MLTIKYGVWSVVAGTAGVIALCIPTDIGSELSATGIDAAVHAQTDQLVRCESAQSVTHEDSRPLAARLEPTGSGATAAKPAKRLINAKVGVLRATPPGRRREQHADVRTTLPASAAPPVFPSTMPIAQQSSVATIQALQHELTRHGCYADEIDGDWGPASRYAAATFIQAVNAKLPTDRPDSILLELARGHEGPVCAQASSLITAATTPIRRVTVTTDALPERRVALPPYSSVSPYGPRVTRVPRIIRENGMNPATDFTKMPLSPPGEMDHGTRMALGVQPSIAPGSQPNSASHDDTSQQKRDATRRAAARSGQRQVRKRASRQRWKRQVFQSINLSGS